MYVRRYLTEERCHAHAECARLQDGGDAVSLTLAPHGVKLLFFSRIVVQFIILEMRKKCIIDI